MTATDRLTATAISKSLCLSCLSTSLQPASFQLLLYVVGLLLTVRIDVNRDMRSLDFQTMWPFSTMNNPPMKIHPAGVLVNAPVLKLPLVEINLHTS